MNIEIKFNKEDSNERTGNGWEWFYGTVKSKGKEFEFTLLEMNTDVGGQNTSATEITWINGTPDNSAIIEEGIVELFEVEFPN